MKVSCNIGRGAFRVASSRAPSCLLGCIWIHLIGPVVAILESTAAQLCKTPHRSRQTSYSSSVPRNRRQIGPQEETQPKTTAESKSNAGTDQSRSAKPMLQCTWDCERTCVSAGAKIPIMPVEKSPPPYVVNRSLLRTEEVPRLVKGERRARDQRTATARDEHPRDQPVDRLGSQNHSQVPARTRWSAGVWAAPGTGQQAGPVQAVPRRTDACRRVERQGTPTRAARAELYGRIHDADRLAAATTNLGANRGRTTIRDATGQASPSGLGPSGDARDGRPGAEALGFYLHAGLQPEDDGRSGAGPEAGHAAAHARRGVPSDGRSPGRDSL